MNVILDSFENIISYFGILKKTLYILYAVTRILKLIG